MAKTTCILESVLHIFFAAYALIITERIIICTTAAGRYPNICSMRNGIMNITTTTRLRVRILAFNIRLIKKLCIFIIEIMDKIIIVYCVLNVFGLNMKRRCLNVLKEKYEYL